MASASRTMHPWDTLEYQRMVSAIYSDGQLVIRFADGSRVELSPGSLVSAGAQKLDWHRVRAEEYHLTVPSSSGEIEIPWDVIRAQSDPAFGAFWSEIAAERATLG